MRHTLRTDSGGRAPFRAPLPAAALTQFVLGVLLTLTLGALRAGAQQAVNSATLGGRIEDANGALMPGVTVTADAVETGRRQTAVSDGEGRYRFPYVPVGTYVLKAEKDGFATLAVRLSRRFRLGERTGFEVIAEGFNVFNRANLQLPNNVYGTGTAPQHGFGLPTAADSPRQVQFGLRLDF